MANSGDIILIAGKGHEKYQIIGSEKIHFDDLEEIIEIFKKTRIMLYHFSISLIIIWIFLDQDYLNLFLLEQEWRNNIFGYYFNFWRNLLIIYIKASRESIRDLGLEGQMEKTELLQWGV